MSTPKVTQAKRISLYVSNKPIQKNGCTTITESFKSVRVDKVRLTPLGSQPHYEARLSHPKEDAPYNRSRFSETEVWRLFRKSENPHLKIPVLREKGETFDL